MPRVPLLRVEKRARPPGPGPERKTGAAAAGGTPAAARTEGER